MVQQLRSLQPKRQILPESPSQAPAPEEAGHFLEDLEGPLLPSEVQHDDDRPCCHSKQVIENRERLKEKAETKRRGWKEVDFGLFFLFLGA